MFTTRFLTLVLSSIAAATVVVNITQGNTTAGAVIGIARRLG
jgi:hypothetical protein